MVFIVTLFLSWTIKIVSNKLEKVFAKTKNFWDDSLIKALRKPIHWFIWIEAFLFLPGIFYQHIHIFGSGGISPIILGRARMLILVGSVFWFMVKEKQWHAIVVNNFSGLYNASFSFNHIISG